MKRILFLHIGQGKAGSTVIQKFVMNNAQLLKEFGIIYPFSRPSPKKLLSPGNIPTMWGWEEKFEQRVQNFKKGHLLLSYEWIFLSLYDRREETPSQFERLMHTIPQDVELHVILYIRDIVDHFRSEYIQSFHDCANHNTPEDFLSGTGSLYYRSPYAVLYCLRQFRNRGVTVTVRKYRSSGLAEDFMEILLGDRTNELMKQAQRDDLLYNRTLMRGEAEFLRLLNQHIAPQKISRTLAVDFIEQVPLIAGEPFLLQEVLIHQLKETFSDTVREINQFVDPEHQLSTDFAVSKGYGDSQNEGIYSFNEKQLEIIAHHMSRYIKKVQSIKKVHSPSLRQKFLKILKLPGKRKQAGIKKIKAFLLGDGKRFSRKS